MMFWFLMIWSVWGIRSPQIPAPVLKTLPQEGTLSAFTWTPVGPEGGHVDRISTNPANPSQKLAISFFLWTDLTGTGWTAVPELGHVMDGHYTQPQKAVVASDGALWYSNDGGFTWTPVLNYGGGFQSMTESPGSTVYVVTDNLLYRTDDGGLTWTQVAPFLYDLQDITYDPQNPQTLFAGVLLGGEALVLKSTDGGNTWTWVIPPGSGFGLFEIMDIEVNPWNSSEVVMSAGGGGPGMLYVSEDGGTTWDTLMGSVSSSLLFATDLEFLSPDSLLVTNLIPRGLYLGVRTGPDWTFTLLDSTGFPMDLTIASDSSLLMATTSGVLVSPGLGQPFLWHNNGLRNVTLYLNEQMPAWSGNRFIVPSSFYGGVLYRTEDGGQTWERIILGQMVFINTIEIAPGDSDVVYLSGIAGDLSGSPPILHTLYRSSDFGTTWQPLDTLSIDDTTATGVSDLHISPSDPNDLLATKLEGLYRSTDGGHTWTMVLPPGVSPSIPGISQDVWVYKADSLYYSPDHGATWQPVLPWLNEPVSMDVASQSPTLFMISPDPNPPWGLKLFRVDPTGAVTTLLDLTNALFATVDAAPGGGLYLTQFTMTGTLFGRSSDQGYTWEWDTLAFAPIWIRGSTSQVLVASFGMGLWRSEDAVVGISEASTSPLPLSHLQVLTPIATGALRFGYTSPYRGEVTVSIFDITGAVVFQSRLLKPTTRWTADVSVQHLVPGLYILEVQEDQGFRHTAKWIRVP